MIEHPEETGLWEKYPRILGMDEAGRGPICGPMTVAGVIFPAGYQNEELDDSKKLTEKKRERLFYQILQDAEAWLVLVVDEKTIDEENIYRAAQHAMEKIALDPRMKSGFVLTDAMPLPALEKDEEYREIPVRSLVKGDSKSLSIAAASILAKVTRDRYMKQLDAENPEYGLARHKGYPTRAHLDAIEQYGIRDFYRRSYGPVARIIDREKQGSLFDL